MSKCVEKMLILKIASKMKEKIHRIEKGGLKWKISLKLLIKMKGNKLDMF